MTVLLLLAHAARLPSRLAGGLTVLDVSDPRLFRVAMRWETKRAVEGQDRIGNLLAVAEMGGTGGGHVAHSNPTVHIFDLGSSPAGSSPAGSSPAGSSPAGSSPAGSSPAGVGDSVGSPGNPGVLQPVASIDLSAHVDGILHLKLYTAADGGVWAICSGGFGKRVAGAVVAVQVQAAASSNVRTVRGGVRVAPARVRVPASPAICVLSTPVSRPEGVSLAGGYAYIGGISSSNMAVVDVTDPTSMRLVSCGIGPGATRRRLPLSGGTQLVPARTLLPTGHVVVAVWGTPGGIAVLDVATPSAPVEVGRCVGIPTALSNRASVHGHHVLVPLEQPIGGVAIYDIANPARPVRLGITHLPLFPLRNSSAYCLAVTTAPGGGVQWLHLFEARACCVHTYELQLPVPLASPSAAARGL